MGNVCKAHGKTKGYCRNSIFVSGKSIIWYWQLTRMDHHNYDDDCDDHAQLLHSIDKRYCRFPECSGGKLSCHHKVDKAFCANKECVAGKGCARKLLLRVRMALAMKRVGLVTTTTYLVNPLRSSVTMFLNTRGGQQGRAANRRGRAIFRDILETSRRVYHSLIRAACRPWIVFRTSNSL